MWEATFEEALLGILLDVVRREMNPQTYQAFELFTLNEMPGAEVARITGISRNAVYQARKEVLRRLQRLGASYRAEGRLAEDIKRAMAMRPHAAVERSVGVRISKTMRSR